MTENKDKDSEFLGGLNKVLGSIGDLVNKLGDLAEKGESLKTSGEFHDKDIKGVFGYSVRVGAGGLKARVESFGNIKRDQNTGESVVVEIREPVVDISEADGSTIIEAEIPGVRADDVSIDIQDTVLIFTAERGDRKYRKEIVLPKPYARENMVVSCNSGILRIKCVADSMDD